MTALAMRQRKGVEKYLTDAPYETKYVQETM